MEPVLPSRSLERWDTLLSRRRVLSRSLLHGAPEARGSFGREIARRRKGGRSKFDDGGPAARGVSDGVGVGGDDPFDVSDLIVPPTSGLVDRYLNGAVEEWRDLGERRIGGDGDEDGALVAVGRDGERADGDGGGEDSDGGLRIDYWEGRDEKKREEEGEEKKKKKRQEEEKDIAARLKRRHFGKHMKRRLLPEGFDYSCRSRDGSSGADGSPPPPKSTKASGKKRRRGSARIAGGGDADDPEEADQPPRPPQQFLNDSRGIGRGGRVISLSDPTETLDYAEELYRIFESVPTEGEIVEEAMEGAICRNSIALRNEIEEGLRDYPRLDGHGLGRMRMRDRHRIPVPLPLVLPAWMTSARAPDANANANGIPSATGAKEATQSAIPSACASTVRVEFWRRRPGRGSTPSSDRMELEFLDYSSDTDGGDGDGEDAPSSSRRTLLDVHRAAVEMAGCVGVGGGGNQGKVRRSDGVGGMFFVEGTFYVHGGDRDIDYAGPVLQWLGLEDEHNNGGGTDDDKKDADEENQGDDVEEEGGRDGRRKKRASSESAAARTSRSLGILRRNYLGIPSSPSATAHLEEEEKRKGRGRPRKNDAAGKRSDGVCTRKKKSGGGGGKKGSKEKKVRKTAPAVSGEEARGDKTAPAAAADAVAASGNDANNEKDGARRPYVRQMSETLLIDVPFRLGVRYYHCWDGDCESSLFFTDVRRIIPTIPPALAAPALGISPALPTVSADDTNRTKNGATAAHRPKVVIHDLWTSPFQPSSSTSSGSGGRILSAPTDKSCRGCRRRPPSSAVYCDEWCDGDGGGGDPPLTPLCSMCLWTLRGGYKEGGGGRDGDGNDEDTGAGTRDNGKDEVEGKGDQGEGEGKDRGVGISPRPPPPPFRTYPLRLLKDAADMSVGHLPTDAHFD